MPLASRTDPYLGARFFVEIEGVDQGGFTECTGLQAEVEVTDYQEGGNNGYVHKLVGRTKFSNVVLKHGVTDSTDFWDWFQDVQANPERRETVTISLLDEEGNPVFVWTIVNAFPVKVSAPDLKSDANEIAVETIELAHEGITQEAQ